MSENSSARSSCAVFVMDDNKLDMSHGDPTGVFGDACVFDHGKLQMSGGQNIEGDALLGTDVDIPDDLDAAFGGRRHTTRK